MGLGGISIWQLLIVLAIVILLFGTKRLRSFGSDLGNSVKGFRKAMDTTQEKDEDEPQEEDKPQAIEESDETPEKKQTPSTEQKEKQG